MWSDLATLRNLKFLVRLGDSLLERDAPDHLVRESVPDVLDLINTEISRSRHENGLLRDPLGSLDLIGSRQAAAELKIGKKRVQQIAEDKLGGRKIDGVGWVFDRAAVAAYATQRSRK
jgi:hypothetical protein